MSRKYVEKTTYNEKYKMWVTVRCPFENDEKSINTKNEMEVLLKNISMNHIKNI